MRTEQNPLLMLWEGRITHDLQQARLLVQHLDLEKVSNSVAIWWLKRLLDAGSGAE